MIYKSFSKYLFYGIFKFVESIFNSNKNQFLTKEILYIYVVCRGYLCVHMYVHMCVCVYYITNLSMCPSKIWDINNLRKIKNRDLDKTSTSIQSL